MPKLLLIVSLLFCAQLVQAQEAQSVPPRIGVKIPLGDHIFMEDYRIGFEKVIEDSRCPTGVDCVWEGRAVVGLSIVAPDGSTEQKEVIIKPTVVKADQLPVLISGENWAIRVLALQPYPEEPAIPMEYKLVVSGNERGQ